VWVEVDTDACDGYARCTEVAPDVFAINSDTDLVRILVEEVPDVYKGRVIAAVEKCPKRALRVDIEF
jgi:ferredoxin